MGYVSSDNLRGFGNKDYSSWTRNAGAVQKGSMVKKMRDQIVAKQQAMMSRSGMTPYEIDALIQQSMPSYQSRAEKMVDKGQYYQSKGMGDLGRSIFSKKKKKAAAPPPPPEPVVTIYKNYEITTLGPDITVIGPDGKPFGKKYGSITLAQKVIDQKIASEEKTRAEKEMQERTQQPPVTPQVALVAAPGLMPPSTTPTMVIATQATTQNVAPTILAPAPTSTVAPVMAQRRQRGFMARIPSAAQQNVARRIATQNKAKEDAKVLADQKAKQEQAARDEQARRDAERKAEEARIAEQRRQEELERQRIAEIKRLRKLEEQRQAELRRQEELRKQREVEEARRAKEEEERNQQTEYERQQRADQEQIRQEELKAQKQTEIDAQKQEDYYEEAAPEEDYYEEAAPEEGYYEEAAPEEDYYEDEESVEGLGRSGKRRRTKSKMKNWRTTRMRKTVSGLGSLGSELDAKLSMLDRKIAAKETELQRTQYNLNNPYNASFPFEKGTLQYNREMAKEEVLTGELNSLKSEQAKLKGEKRTIIPAKKSNTGMIVGIAAAALAALMIFRKKR